MVKPVFRFVSGLMLLMASVLVAQIDQPWTQRSVEMEAERLRDARRSAAASVDQVAAYFSVAQDRDTELYLLNLITDPVAVEISVVSPSGHRLGLGTLTVEANQHAALSLRTWLDSASKEFSEGSLWLRYLGDAETLQAWTVYHNGNQSFEIPLVGPNELTGQELLSFWAAAEGVEAQHYLLNVSTSPVRFTVTASP